MRQARPRVLTFVLWLSMLLPAVTRGDEPAAPQVVQFTPQGTVKKVRQVTARFSEPMVPLGDPRAARDPFVIDCREKGRARWVDSRNWAYDFARDLPAGVECTFTLRADLTTLLGKPIGGEQSFAFSTGGPAIQVSSPREGDRSIEEEQAFVLVLDAEASAASILQHVSFSIEGRPERVGVRILSGDARDAILKTFWHGFLSGPAVVLQARQRFPNGAKVSLVWGKGVASVSGVASEQDQVLEFKTRKAFTARFQCERENAKSGCIPLTPARVRFSAPVAWEQARRIVMVGPDGQRWSADAEEKLEGFVDQVVFKGPFPENADVRVEVPHDLTDDAGRPLANAERYPLSVKMNAFPPLAKFSARFGILEAKAEPALPVTLRNIEPEVQGKLLTVTQEPQPGIGATIQQMLAPITGNVSRIPPDHLEEILPWLRRVARARRDVSIFAANAPGQAAKPFTLPKPNGTQAFEVVGIPFTTPGLYIVELASPRLGASLLGQPRPMYVPAAALVTNLSVHLKWGRDSSLVWVTTLDDAHPVEKAQINIQDCRGRILWSGETDRQGIARIDQLPRREALPTCYDLERTDATGASDYQEYAQTPALSSLYDGLLVTARTADDLSFVHSNWKQGIEPWRFQLPTELWTGPVVAHTIFDRALFRAGDTVHMKHILRRQTLQGFSAVPEKERPSLVSIRHVGSDQKYELPLQWDAGGIAESTWQIPKEAKLGRYQVVLPLPGPNRWGHELTAGTFRVQEFRVPLMKGVVKLPAEPQVAVSEIPADLSVQYLAGGPARQAPVVLRAQIRPWAMQNIDAFEHFTFANGSVKEGIIRRGTSEEEEEEAGTPEKPGVHQRQDLVLDDAGTARTTITKLPRTNTLRELLAEMEFRDPNGEVQTVSATVPLWPAKWLVGVKPDSWASTDRVSTQVAVVDTARRPVAGAPVRIDLLEHKTYSSRKRLVGGFYAYDNVEETWPAGELCHGRTDAHGLLRCEGKPPVEGNVILQATVTDADGNATAAHSEVWVRGKQDWWFPVEDSDRMDVLPEKRRYEPGETARLQVRMPFREATALVTVEREGIATASVVHLSGKDPIVEVPVSGEYAPNVFISVLAVRGRVGDVQPTAMVDLGRPAFKLGITEIRVGWQAHELKVSVAADRQTYKVRDTATVTVGVKTADGTPLPPGSEVALAAVDEGLLELQPNTSWDLLEAMMGRRGYGIANATAQMQVVGKRHFGLKALPQGGGGGRQVTRELFDTLLLWKGRVPLDAQGAAVVRVPLNDSLTSFRIVAVATGGVDRFGTGATSIRSTQDLMLLAGVAPLARAGDEFASEFTVRNTTTRTMDVSVSGHVEGLRKPLEPRTIHLSPGAALVVDWRITAPADTDALVYDVNASEPGGAADHVRVTQHVRPAVPVRTFQATLFRWEAGSSANMQPVARPADAVPGRGGVQVILAPTLVGGLAGLTEWMTDYPYSCLEQKVSRAVALNDAALWHAVVAALPSYLDADGLLKYFPTIPSGSEVLTAYVLSITQAAGLEIPADVQGQMESGLRKFINGMIAREPELRTADLSLRKLAAIDALARAGKAEPALLGSVTIEPNLWPTSGLLDWWSLLHRIRGVAGGAARQRDAEQMVRARLNLQGTTMGFSTEGSDDLWWLMVDADVNATRMIVDLLENREWSEDLPRLMRGALGRQQRGRWSSTVANAWGALAVRKFSERFERTPVTGVTTGTLDGTVRRADWTQPPKEAVLDFAWPAAPQDLTVNHTGTGHPWVTVQSRAAIPLRAAFSSGYQIKKTITPLEPRAPSRFSRGDLLRVRLEIEAQSDMTWVVVDDPIPAGASHLGTGLARESQLATQGEAVEGRAFPAFEERPFDAFRAYYEFVPKGGFVTEYTIRLNQSGRFQLPPTRVEALYAPEMFGELPNAPIEVEP